jgi:hypothetical protein
MLTTPFTEDAKTILREAGFIVQVRQAHLIGQFQNIQRREVQFVVMISVDAAGMYSGQLSKKYKGGMAAAQVSETVDKDLHFLIAQLLDWKLVEETKVLLSS